MYSNRYVRRFDERFPAVETNLTEFETVIALTAVLVGGLAFATPLAKALLGVPLLAGVAVTCGTYAVTTLLLREVERGAYVALIVTATFPANVPLSQDAVFGVVSDMGREVFLVHGPLAVLAAFYVWRGWYDVRSMHLTEKLLLAFVGWTLVAGVLGGADRLDAVAFAALFYLLAFLAFSSVRRAVSVGILRGKSVFASLALTVLGHVVVALVQFANQRGFGYTELGEGNHATVGTIGIGPLGPLSIGPFVSGFARWELGTLLLLSVFIVFGYALGSRGRRRFVGTLLALLFVATLRIHGFDSDRGGIIVGLVVFSVGTVTYRYYASRRSLDRLSLRDRITSARQALPNRPSIDPWGPIATACLFAVALYPTSMSGRTRENAELEPSTATTGSGSESLEGLALILERLASSSIPFFDLSSLLPRAEQFFRGTAVYLNSPLFGIGAANWKYLPDVGMRIHNAYLMLLVETGAVGLILYGAAVTTALLSGIRVIAKNSENAMLYLGAVAGVIGFSAAIFFTPFDKYSLLLPLWIVLGVLVGERIRLEKQTTSVPSTEARAD